MYKAKIGDKVKVNKNIYRWSNRPRKSMSDDPNKAYSLYKMHLPKYTLYACEGEEGIVKEIFANEFDSKKKFHVKIETNDGFIKTLRQTSLELIKRPK